MDKPFFILLVLLLAPFGAAAQTPELDRAAALSAQVVKLYQANRPNEGLPLAKEALALREKALGPEVPLVAQALHNLASLYFRLNEQKQALPPAQRALAILEKTKPLDENGLTGTLTLVGAIYYADVNYKEAANHFQRALTLREKLSGPEHPQTLDLVLTLANAYKNSFQIDSAEFLYRGYIETQTRRGAAAQDIGEATERLACVLWYKGDEDEAKKTEQRADALLGYGNGPFLKVKPSELRRQQLSESAVKIALDGNQVKEFRYFAQIPVTVRLLLNEKGEPLRACGVWGPVFLRPYYENAALRSRFKSFTNNNAPTKAQGEINFVFEPGATRRRGN
jgi:tetratricopeptide (TPR) repeat protein